MAEGQPGRYQRSASGMVGAMILCVLLVAGFVLFRSLVRTDPDGTPKALDYRSDVRDLQESGVDVIYPRSLPSGWKVTHVDYVPGSTPGFGLSMLTPANQYVGFREDSRSVPDLLSTYVDANATGGDTATVEGAITSSWTTWADEGGDHAYATTYGGQSLLVFGSGSDADLRTVLTALTTEPLPKRGS